MNTATENTASEESVEVEIETEAPAQSQSSAVTEDDDELGAYSSKVQSRINKLTEKRRQAERDAEEAKRLAQVLYEEKQRLEERVRNLDSGYLSEYGSRLETQAFAAKEAFKKAYESGDADALSAAQEQMAKIAIDQERFRLAKQRASAQQPVQVERQQYAQQQMRQMPPEEPKVDPKAKSWAEKNDWFGSDKLLTAAAMALHSTLVEDEGFDPASDEYYSEIDRRIRREFPHKFKSAQTAAPARVASGAASASKAASPGRRQVRLTASQVAMAKRLNVPLDEYAKYVKD